MKILVAGIGNIFLSDDGFGVEVANRLATEQFPSEVKVSDFGIRGVHLAYELLDGYDALVLIDAVDLRDAPGTLAIIEPEKFGPDQTGEDFSGVDAHNMGPEVVLGTLANLGGSVDQIFVVGCQPETLEEGMGLSPAVAESVDPAVQLCKTLVADILRPVRKRVTA
jgi:hydrogenase maturation protease